MRITLSKVFIISFILCWELWTSSFKEVFCAFCCKVNTNIAGYDCTWIAWSFLSISKVVAFIHVQGKPFGGTSWGWVKGYEASMRHVGIVGPSAEESEHPGFSVTLWSQDTLRWLWVVRMREWVDNSHTSFQMANLWRTVGISSSLTAESLA